MASYRETLNLLLLANAENIIDDNELLLLFNLIWRKCRMINAKLNFDSWR
jgi:hypothetical protein